MIYTLFSCFVSFLFDSTTLTLHPTHAVVETSMRGIQKSPFNLLIYFENDFELISYEKSILLSHWNLHGSGGDGRPFWLGSGHIRKLRKSVCSTTRTPHTHTQTHIAVVYNSASRRAQTLCDRSWQRDNVRINILIFRRSQPYFNVFWVHDTRLSALAELSLALKTFDIHTPITYRFTFCVGWYMCLCEQALPVSWWVCVMCVCMYHD